MDDFTPLWKTPTRAQAVSILRSCRAWTDAAISALSPAQLETPTALGDGTWTVKDLLGHLASWETRALEIIGIRQKEEHPYASADEFNAHHLEIKRVWSLEEVRHDYDTVRSELVRAIVEMEDEGWLSKIETASGRSALALVLAKLLNGGKYGYLAHDFAHGRDLEKALRLLRQDDVDAETRS